MGLDTNGTKALFFAKSTGVKFQTTLMLGRQHLFAARKDIREQAKRYGIKSDGMDSWTGSFSEPFFHLLGAETVESMDYSDYEGASIVFDLNNPVPESLFNRYSVVFDGGTLEHVFNFPVAIKNCMRMVATGGHFISITPANNMMGHGFYQFSPELFYRVLSRENGFAVEHIFVYTPGSGKWYAVKDPHEVHERVLLTNSAETLMIAIAKKLSNENIFAKTPLQSDYAETWQTDEVKKVSDHPAGSSPVKKLYQKAVPAFVRDAIWRLRYKAKHKKTYDGDLGYYNPNHFMPFDR